jgi:hypothetical protein
VGQEQFGESSLEPSGEWEQVLSLALVLGPLAGEWEQALALALALELGWARVQEKETDRVQEKETDRELTPVAGLVKEWEFGVRGC